MEKQLTPAEWGHIYDLVEDVLETIRYDDTGVTDDLMENAAIVAEILQIALHEDEKE
jgi:hypothetical protein